MPNKIIVNLVFDTSEEDDGGTLKSLFNLLEISEIGNVKANGTIALGAPVLLPNILYVVNNEVINQVKFEQFVCPVCHGRGFEGVDISDMIECAFCNGTGKIPPTKE